MKTNTSPPTTSVYSELVPANTLTKSEAKLRADNIIAKVEGNEMTAIDVLTKLKYIMEVCKGAIDGIKEYSVTEAQGYDKHESININGAKVELSNKSEYDFTGCNDDWSIYTAQAEQLKVKIKERETFLKTLTKSITVADEETGEMKTIKPPVKLSEPIIKVTFSK